MKYQASQPYPKVEVKAKNPYYATLLLEDYSGIVSELSAITQYIYQRIECFWKYPEYAEALFHIAVVEMRHLELLGEMITLLGGSPQFHYYDFSCRQYRNWNSQFLNTQRNIKLFLNYDILLEKQMIQGYLNRIQCIQDPFVQKMLYRIIEDEKIHIQCFQTLLKNLKNNNC